MINDLMLYVGETWFIALLASMGAIVLLAPLFIYLRKTRDVRRMKRAIKKYSQASEKKAVLSDGIDGYIFVDYLILMRDRILAMKVMKKQGYVFGGENINEWTCVENNKTEKFKNPLEEVKFFAEQIKHDFGYDAVEAYVLFDGKSIFPKGVPLGVLQIETFGEKLGMLNETCDSEAVSEVNKQHQEVWLQLLNRVKEDKGQLQLVLTP